MQELIKKCFEQNGDLDKYIYYIMGNSLLKQNQGFDYLMENFSKVEFNDDNTYNLELSTGSKNVGTNGSYDGIFSIQEDKIDFDIYATIKGAPNGKICERNFKCKNRGFYGNKYELALFKEKYELVVIKNELYIFNYFKKISYIGVSGEYPKKRLPDEYIARVAKVENHQVTEYNSLNCFNRIHIWHPVPLCLLEEYEKDGIDTQELLTKFRLMHLAKDNCITLNPRIPKQK